MAVTTTNLGVITAYGDAVAAGYTGTKAEWQALMASYATVAEDANQAKDDAVAAKNAAVDAKNAAVQAKDTAVAAKDTATSKATEATTAANTATTKANEASASAQSIAQSASQITQNTSDISELKEDLTQKANQDGYYADLVSGGSTQLLSDMVETDTTPYNYRTAGGSLEIGDRMKLKKIVGGSVAWNQLVKEINSQNWSAESGVTATFNDNKIVFTSSSVSYGVKTNAAESFLPNHVYLANASMKVTSAGSIAFLFGSLSGVTAVVSVDTTEKRIGGLAKTSSNTSGRSFFITALSSSVNVEITVKNVVVHDLTAMFGSTIADYIYSLEQATAGAGVAFFKSLFPKDYYPYNAGTLEHVSGLSAHKMTGFNQWDEEWEQGGLVDGNPSTDASRVRSKNYCECVANTAYYRHCGKGAGINIFWYDADKNYISYEAGTSTAVVTSPANARYFKICTTTAYGGTYLNDICINLHWDGELDGEYEPYEEHSYPLDSDVTLRGIPKLDANNNLYYDGDEYVSDGTVTRRYGVVDLGTLTWNQGASNKFYNTVSVSPAYIAPVNTSSAKANILCSKYEYGGGAGTGTELSKDKVICYDWNNIGRFIIFDTTYSDAATFKAAMSGVMLVYELATPTTEEADPYTEIQNVSNWGTEEFVTTSLVPVGHETAYQPDLRAKIEVAPESPDTDGLYLMKRENGQNSYVAYLGELPSDPTTDGTYTLKCTVRGGTATKTWEADE